MLEYPTLASVTVNVCLWQNEYPTPPMVRCTGKVVRRMYDMIGYELRFTFLEMMQPEKEDHHLVIIL